MDHPAYTTERAACAAEGWDLRRDLFNVEFSAPFPGPISEAVRARYQAICDAGAACNWAETSIDRMHQLMDANDVELMSGRISVQQHGARAHLLGKARGRAAVAMMRRQSALIRAVRA